jgi:CHAT domain-containing protein
VRAKLPGAARLHVAAHGQFDAIEPARSGIVLGTEDGRYETLTLHELRELDLSALQLATLATCRSAEHARMPGRERVCLPTAFLDAGARGVIASLWPVEGESSLDVMRALYVQLRDHRPAVALARMQAELGRRPEGQRVPTPSRAGSQPRKCEASRLPNPSNDRAKTKALEASFLAPTSAPTSARQHETP